MIGQRVLHYQVTEKLGEGGMGVVYKADDTKLQRTVALKFLSPQVLENPEEAERLINEARSAASLHHPNICTIYEINEFEGQPFIAMAYVDGPTLRQRMSSGALDTDTALQIALQAAEGLNQAHSSGIIHRDIKPGNILLDEAGQAQIMDFGLAKRFDQAGSEETSSSGGTSAYMSPEQAGGDAVDHRTDVWSLGVVMYEMLTAELPFRGDYREAIVYSILNEEPAPVESHGKEIPGGVKRIIYKCLQKDPDERYASVAEVIDDLRTALGLSPPSSGRPAAAVAGMVARKHPRFVVVGIVAVLTIIAVFVAADFFGGKEAGSEVRIPIAVIDFYNETGQPELDGLSGMLITALEQSRRLSVMTRSRMFDLLGSLGQDDVTRIDETLGREVCRTAEVGALVIPTIRKFGNLYSIDLKVLDTSTSTYVFTTKEEGPGEESIPQMIDAIAKRIRIDLDEGRETIDASQPIAEVTTVNIDAYQHYFTGERYLAELEFDSAGQEFARAVELDPNFALAHYRLAYTKWWSRNKAEDALVHVDRALELIDRIPEKERFLVRALNAALREGFEAQIPIFEAMEERYPEEKEMLFGLGDAAFHSNKFEKAEHYFDKVLALDPRFERALQHQTWTYLNTEQANKACTLAARWVETTQSAEAYRYLGMSHCEAGDDATGLVQIKKAHAMAPDDYDIARSLAKLHLILGEHESAVAVLQSMMSEDRPQETVYRAGADLSTAVYPYLGRYQKAVAMQDAGFEQVIASGDTTAALQVLTSRGLLRFWGWNDTEGAKRDVALTETFPDRLKKQDYWYDVAALYALTGEFDKMQRAVAEHLESDAGKRSFDVLRLAMSGECSSAQAMADTMLADTKDTYSKYKTTLHFAVGVCQHEQGDHEAAIRNLSFVTDQERFDYGRALMLPKAHYLVGIAYEQSGEPRKAAEHFRKLIEIWSSADQDLPDLIDAKARLGALAASESM